MICLDSLCDYSAALGRIACVGGGGGYARAIVRDASLSDFYDQTLRDASYQIREILSRIPKDADGRMLAMLNTRQGFLLAWVEHSDEEPEPGITIANSEEEIARALGLIPLENAE